MTPKELRELEQKACPIPLKVVNGNRIHDEDWDIGSVEHSYGDTEYPIFEEDDARFLVALRNLSPKLIALWEAAEDVKGRLEEWWEDDDVLRFNDALKALYE